MTNSIEKLEKKRKSGALAAGLNLIIPGAGYIYCGRVILGIAAFILTVLLVLTLFPYGAIAIWIVLIIDGFLIIPCGLLVILFFKEQFRKVIGGLGGRFKFV